VTIVEAKTQTSFPMCDLDNGQPNANDFALGVDPGIAAPFPGAAFDF